MAAALLEQRAGGTIRVRSAGSDPGDAVHPEVLEAMREVGIDLAERRPTQLREDSVRAADVVITMGCGDACPVFPGKRYEEWELDDPAGKSREDVRRIRDEIGRRVDELVESLAPARAQ